jgi:hypothetical protein
MTVPIKKSFNLRAFVVVAAGVAGLGLPLTGFANHLLQMDFMTPRRHAWMSAHNSLGVVFVVFTVWHVILNRRVFLNYVRGVASRWRHINREALWATGLVTLIVLIAVGHTIRHH